MVINLKKEIIFQSLQLFFAQFAVAKKLPKKNLIAKDKKKIIFFLFFQGYLMLFQRICNEIIGLLLEQPELYRAFFACLFLDIK